MAINIHDGAAMGGGGRAQRRKAMGLFADQRNRVYGPMGAGIASAGDALAEALLVGPRAEYQLALQKDVRAHESAMLDKRLAPVKKAQEDTHQIATLNTLLSLKGLSTALVTQDVAGKQANINLLRADKNTTDAELRTIESDRNRELRGNAAVIEERKRQYASATMNLRKEASDAARVQVSKIISNRDENYVRAKAPAFSFLEGREKTTNLIEKHAQMFSGIRAGTSAFLPGDRELIGGKESYDTIDIGHNLLQKSFGKIDKLTELHIQSQKQVMEDGGYGKDEKQKAEWEAREQRQREYGEVQKLAVVHKMMEDLKSPEYDNFDVWLGTGNRERYGAKTKSGLEIAKMRLTDPFGLRMAQNLGGGDTNFREAMQRYLEEQEGVFIKSGLGPTEMARAYQADLLSVFKAAKSFVLEDPEAKANLDALFKQDKDQLTKAGDVLKEEFANLASPLKEKQADLRTSLKEAESGLAQVPLGAQYKGMEEMGQVISALIENNPELKKLLPGGTGSFMSPEDQVEERGIKEYEGLPLTPINYDEQGNMIQTPGTWDQSGQGPPTSQPSSQPAASMGGRNLMGSFSDNPELFDALTAMDVI